MISDLNSIIHCLEKELIKGQSNISVPKDTIDKIFMSAIGHELIYWKDKTSKLIYVGIGVLKKIKSLDEYKSDLLNFHSFGAQYFEKDQHKETLWEDFDKFHYIVPNYVFIQNEETLDLTLHKYTKEMEPLTNLFDFKITHKTIKNSLTEKTEKPNKQEWVESVSKLKENLSDQFNKVVLSKMTTIKLKDSIDSKSIFIKNKKEMNNCHHFYISPKKGISFFSLTPETLYKKENDFVLVDAIAGTRSRGINQDQDNLLGQELLESKKDRDEHNIVIDMITNAINTFGKIEQEETKLLKLKNVYHLYTPIKIQVMADKSFVGFIDLLHPTPAVGGFPKDQAQSYIRQHEFYERGFYAGPIGHINKDVEEIAVGIRSALVKENKAYIFGGCGIIKDSDPEEEWIEINQKTKYLVDSFYE